MSNIADQQLVEALRKLGLAKGPAVQLPPSEWHVRRETMPMAEWIAKMYLEEASGTPYVNVIVEWAIKFYEAGLLVPVKDR